MRWRKEEDGDDDPDDKKELNLNKEKDRFVDLTQERKEGKRCQISFWWGKKRRE